MMKSLLMAAIVVGTGCAAAPPPRTIARDLSCHEVLSERDAQLYDPGRIRYAAPLYKVRFVARAIQPRELAGAELYMDAVAGVSPEYLERVLSCHAAGTSSAHRNDPLRVPTIHDVDVRGQGPYFVITVLGTDREAGRDIWAKAEALMTE